MPPLTTRRSVGRELVGLIGALAGFGFTFYALWQVDPWAAWALLGLVVTAMFVSMIVER
jgi:hypothetical protein